MERSCWRGFCSSNLSAESWEEKTRSVVESSERLEKECSGTIKTTVAKNDLVWSLLGDGEKQEPSDGHPYPDDDCDVLPTWRTLAVDARGLDQTNEWCGKRLVTAPPPSSTRRAEQNTKQRRHDRPEKSNLLLDHQSGCSLWRPAVPPRRSSSTDTKISSRSFEEQHWHWD